MSGQTIERLPDAELEVMQAIWDCEPPVSRADIEPLLQRRHPMATTTLLTLLGRLTQKGYCRPKSGARARCIRRPFRAGSMWPRRAAAF